MDKAYQCIDQLFNGLNKHDTQIIENLWHKEGTLHIGNELKEIAFMTQLPDFIEFRLLDKAVLHESGNLIICKCSWEMIMPNVKGVHESYLTFARESNEVKILSMIDYGREI